MSNTPYSCDNLSKSDLSSFLRNFYNSFVSIKVSSFRSGFVHHQMLTDMSSDEAELSGVEEETEVVEDQLESVKPGKSIRPGIIYLSSIPYHMGVRKIRDYFGQFGAVGRLFLQAESHRSLTTGRKEKNFAEGWVEFKSKKIAKRVAKSLNNQPVGGKKRSKAAEALWNLKYLSNFSWIHLSEQIAYEKASNQQRLRTEISMAKRTAEYFSQGVEKGKNLRRLEEETLRKGGKWETFQRQLKQRKNLSEQRKKKGSEADKEVLSMIFTQ